MKTINKIFAFLLVVGIAVGIYLVSQLRIFESIQIDLKTTAQFSFNPTNTFCFSREESIPTLAKKHFRLLSWNIHKGSDQGWQQDLARFSQDQDFVLLQEATPEQNLSSFSTALFISSFSYKGRQSGVKTFSRTVPKSYCGIAEPEPWIRIPKVAGVMTFPLNNGGELFVINAHLINFEWQPDAYRTQLEQIFSLIPSYQSAVILAGDFNAWNAERKQILDEFMRKKGVNEVSFSQDERVRFFDYPLDYVFVRGMKVLTATSKKVASSDHSPVWLEFILE
ncbi:endonuclease/exonuclease/phosphatase family protein [Rodentibacter caecimuris]|uniref:endonuclease/exonuclease/phosphatase family protein n=1 Tax=Rodentibacter caecimuris TaxID=1796644 RepID=UPI001094D197|nr:endonuclease/exonuclease/phosphatase family protein [Pasteurella caecimuris]TGY50458.1 endonuclease/exonuclease/phosphatase family protein [Pasteurella caecimuris]